MTRPARRPHLLRPVDHAVWPALAVDTPVALVNAGGWRLSGTVETLSEDRACLWIRLDAGLGRQLIHHQDGFELEAPHPATV